MDRYEPPLIDLGEGDGEAPQSVAAVAAVVVVEVFGVVVTTGAAAVVLVAESGGVAHFGVVVVPEQ